MEKRGKRGKRKKEWRKEKEKECYGIGRMEVSKR
jgi:hypothetical protein